MIELKELIRQFSGLVESVKDLETISLTATRMVEENKTSAVEIAQKIEQEVYDLFAAYLTPINLQLPEEQRITNYLVFYNGEKIRIGVSRIDSLCISAPSEKYDLQEFGRDFSCPVEVYCYHPSSNYGD